MRDSGDREKGRTVNVGPLYDSAPRVQPGGCRARTTGWIAREYATRTTAGTTNTFHEAAGILDVG